MGYRLLQRLAADVSELGVVESNPKQDGRNMVMVIAPHRNAALQAQPAQHAAQAERRQATAERTAEKAAGRSAERPAPAQPDAPQPDAPEPAAEQPAAEEQAPSA